jgi:hypothetical protein
MLYEAMLKHKVNVIRDYDTVTEQEREKAEKILAQCADKPVRRLSSRDYVDGQLKAAND